MNRPAVCAAALALAAAVSVSLGLAQDKADPNTTPEPKGIAPAPPPAAKSPPQQGGTQQPSTAAPGGNTQSSALINGSLAVPGAPTDTETTPSKYSARNAASDQLATVAFRLKNLSDDQKRQIYQQLAGKSAGLALSPVAEEEQRYARIGTELPASIALHHLTPLPEAVVASHPELAGGGFMKAGANVLIVDMDNSEVVGVLSPQ